MKKRLVIAATRSMRQYASRVAEIIRQSGGDAASARREMERILADASHS